MPKNNSVTPKNLSIGLVLLAITTVLSAPLSAQETFSALVIQSQGIAKVQRDGKELPAKKDMLISSGDVIITKAGAQVGLQFAGGISCSIGPDSEVKVEKLLRENEKRQITLGIKKGSLINRARVSEGQALDMQVNGTTLIAAVRGTEFAVESNGDSESSIAVNEGSVVVNGTNDAKNGIKDVTLKAGEKIRASFDEAKQAIMDARDKARFEILEKLESMKKAQFEAFTEQVRKNEALREQMRNRILNPN
ncbi:MAG: FecR domain-containing protein [Leptospiraceae bacterium]|nr:FecR domain-containing protein [Leptospiraceae bacterium]